MRIDLIIQNISEFSILLIGSVSANITNTDIKPTISTEPDIQELLTITDVPNTETKQNKKIRSFFIRSDQALNNKVVEIDYGDNQTKIIELTPPEELQDEYKSGEFYESQLIGNLGDITSVEVREMDSSEYEVVARYAPVDEELYQVAAEHGYGNIGFEKAYKKAFYSKLGIPDIVLREEWGAPTYSNWGPWIVPVDTIVVHHTAFAVNLNDPRETVRDIYFEHANRCSPYVSNCEVLWDDIGYNYLIDPYGRIYEGRSGGNGVVAAHSPPNYGTIGIGLMGNFHYDDVPTPEAISTLTYLIGRLSALNDIEPIWEQTIVGHNHRNSTACPGAYLFANMPAVTANAVIVRNASTDLLNLRQAFVNFQQTVGDEAETITLSNLHLLTEQQKLKIFSLTRNELKTFVKNNLLYITIPGYISKQYVIELEMVYSYLELLDSKQILELPTL